MDAYKHGFVVKSQKELEELMGPLGSDSWYNKRGEWSDSFPSHMMEYIGRPSFEEQPYVITDVRGRGSKVKAWGWNFDTRWVHELKRCTFEEMINSSIPFDNVYAVCVPNDIEERISMRAGLTKDEVDLVPSDVAVALKNTVVPDHTFVYLTSEVVDVIDYLGHLWLPNELEILYVEPARFTKVFADEYIEKYKGKGVSYRIFGYPGLAGVEYVDMSIFDKTYKIDDISPVSHVIFADRYMIPLGCIWVKVKVEV